LENHLQQKTPLVGIVVSFPRGIREMVVTKPFFGRPFLGRWAIPRFSHEGTDLEKSTPVE